MRADEVNRWGSRVLILALLSWWLTQGQRVRADAPPSVMAGVAEDCHKWLKARKLNAINVGEISPRAKSASSDQGLRQELIEQLKHHSIMVKEKAEVTLHGTYTGLRVRDIRDRSWVRLVVNFKFILEGAERKILGDWELQINDEEAVQRILKVTVERRVFGKKGDELLLASFTKPKTHFDGTAVLAASGSSFGLEILVDGKPLKPVDREGQAFAPIPRGSNYAVRVINRSKFAVAVQLNIDGLSMFAFTDLRHKEGAKKGQPLYTLILAPAGESVTVPGWHRTNDRSDRFLVTEYPRSGAAMLRKKNDGEVGAISATFAAAWEKNPPEGEPPPVRGSDYATGFGQPQTKKYDPVPRKVGIVRATVSVRYTVPKAE